MQEISPPCPETGNEGQIAIKVPSQLSDEQLDNIMLDVDSEYMEITPTQAADPEFEDVERDGEIFVWKKPYIPVCAEAGSDGGLRPHDD